MKWWLLGWLGQAGAVTTRAWWYVLLAIAFGVAAAILDAQSRTVTFAIGRFGATDDELGQCYFSIGQGASLALHPKGEYCPLARELIGHTGTLIFVLD